MSTILLTIIITFILIKYLIFLDIILSWITNSKPQFISSILDPIYKLIKSKISTNFWPLDFTPIIVLIFIDILIYFVYSFDNTLRIKIDSISHLLNLF